MKWRKNKNNPNRRWKKSPLFISAAIPTAYWLSWSCNGPQAFSVPATSRVGRRVKAVYSSSTFKIEPQQNISEHSTTIDVQGGPPATYIWNVLLQ